MHARRTAIRTGTRLMPADCEKRKRFEAVTTSKRRRGVRRELRIRAVESVGEAWLGEGCIEEVRWQWIIHLSLACGDAKRVAISGMQPRLAQHNPGHSLALCNVGELLCARLEKIKRTATFYFLLLTRWSGVQMQQGLRALRLGLTSRGIAAPSSHTSVASSPAISHHR